MRCNQMIAEGNLRGKRVSFDLGGRTIHGVVVTRIRGARWMIEASRLPRAYACGVPYALVRRIILERDQFVVADDRA